MSLPDRYRLGALIIFLAGSFLLGLYPLLVDLHHLWTELYGPFEHGYLVLAMACWIAVHEWRRGSSTDFAPSAYGLGVLLVCVAMLLALELLSINSGRLALLPMFFLASAWASLGYRTFRRLLWAAAFVYFALPQWWLLNSSLQSLTVFSVTTILQLTNIPAFIEFNEVYLPAGTFQIAEGCSGLNYLMAGTSLASFLAMTRLENWKFRGILVVTAAVLAILFNWLRVFALVLIGYVTDMQHYLVRVEHHTFGWVLFLLVMLPLLWVSGRFERQERPEQSMELSDSNKVLPASISFANSWIWLLVSVLLISPGLFLG